MAMGTAAVAGVCSSGGLTLGVLAALRFPAAAAALFEELGEGGRAVHCENNAARGAQSVDQRVQAAVEQQMEAMAAAGLACDRVQRRLQIDVPGRAEK